MLRHLKKGGTMSPTMSLTYRWFRKKQKTKIKTEVECERRGCEGAERARGGGENDKAH